jgi:hypothetical protein
VLLYSSPNDDIAHIAVQLQTNDRVSVTVYCCFDYKNCTRVDGWEKSTKVVTVATKIAQK